MLFDSESISAGIWTLQELPDEKKGVVAFSLQKNVVYVGNPQNTGLTEQDGFTVLTLHSGHNYVLSSDHMELASIDFGFPVFHEFYFMDNQIVPTNYIDHHIRIRREIRNLEEKKEKSEKELEDKQLELSREHNNLKISLQQEKEKARGLEEKLEAEFEKGQSGRARSRENAKKKKLEELNRERIRTDKIRRLEAENIELAAKLDERDQNQNEVEVLKAALLKLKKQLKSEKKESESSDSDRKRVESKTDSSGESRKYNLLKQRSTEKPKATIEPLVLNLRPAVKMACDEGNPGYVEMEPIKRYVMGEGSAQETVIQIV